MGKNLAGCGYQTRNQYRGIRGSKSVNNGSLRLTLNINTNAEDYQGLGSVEPVDFINRDFTVTVDFELALENTTYKNLTLNNTFQAMSIAFINDNNSIGASSEYPT